MPRVGMLQGLMSLARRWLNDSGECTAARASAHSPFCWGWQCLAVAPRGHLPAIAVHSQELWMFPAWMGVRVRESTSHNFRRHPWISGRLRREVNSDRTLPWNKPLSGDLTNGQQLQSGCFSQWWVDNLFDDNVGNPCFSRRGSLIYWPSRGTRKHLAQIC